MMATYNYQPLKKDRQEIRLVALLPGGFQDDLKLNIFHASLVAPQKAPETLRLSVERLQQTLPWNWTAHETREGDVLFRNLVTKQASWSHPDPNFDPRLHAPAPDHPESDFQPNYEALSYVWGSPNDPETAYIELQSLPGSQSVGIRQDYAIFSIGRNLASALKYLRYEDRARTLWIDAVCINQADIIERNEQVKRMADIYNLAQRVVAWLGTETQNSNHAISIVRDLGQQLVSLVRITVMPAPGYTGPANICDDTYHMPYDDYTWSAIQDFLQRPWFYRLWIWQEIRLGSRHSILQCGHDTILWTHFWQVMILLLNKPRLPSVNFRESCRHVVLFRFTHFLFDTLRTRNCADPKDKVYGVLGIVNQTLTANIKPNYSLPVETIYREIFLAHVEMTKRLELFRHCDLKKRLIFGSSWVPDWSWSATELIPPILNVQVCTGESRPHLRLISSDVLEVVGVHYDYVHAVKGGAPESYDKALSAIPAWAQELPDEKIYVTRESIFDAFAATLCMGRSAERYPHDVNFPSLAEWTKTVRAMISTFRDGVSEDMFSRKNIVNSIHKIRGRAMITTKKSYLGLAPAGVQPGDLVSLILGYYNPMILRPLPAGQFKVVGDSYIHGLNDAVGLLGPLPAPWKGIFRVDSMGRHMHLYYNPVTRQSTPEDPRLDSLPSDWQRLDHERREDDPEIFHRFKNIITGEVVNSDPRLTPEALMARGVELTSFRLI